MVIYIQFSLLDITIWRWGPTSCCWVCGNTCIPDIWWWSTMIFLWAWHQGKSIFEVFTMTIGLAWTQQRVWIHLETQSHERSWYLIALSAAAIMILLTRLSENRITAYLLLRTFPTITEYKTPIMENLEFRIGLSS